MWEKDMWQNIIISLIPSLVVAAITAFLTVRLSVKQFRTQRWWERKADAYSKIAESLHHLIDYCDVHEREDRDWAVIPPERKKQLEEAYSISYNELVKVTNIGSFIISSDAANVLEELRKRDKGNWKTDPAWEIYASDARAYREALTQIRNLAKKDLNVD
jgi:hypothetical protein